MEKEKIEDLVDIDNNDLIPNRILEIFISKQKNKYKINIEKTQKANLLLLFQLLYFPIKEKYQHIPIIVNIQMGQGKSKALEEYYKFMAIHDRKKKLNDIVVKKLNEEARDFVMEIGCEASDYNKYYDDAKEEGKGHLFYKHNENNFIAAFIRGFNKEDCINSEYNKIEIEENNINYDFRYCGYCDIDDCIVKKIKKAQFFKRVIVISHARLFFSNDYNETLSNLKLTITKDEKSSNIFRENLIIDEKIDTIEIIVLDLEEFLKLKNKIILTEKKEWINFIKFLEKKYFNEIEFPYSSKEGCNKQIKVETSDINFKIFDELEDEIANPKKYKINFYKTFIKLKHIVSCNYIFTSRKYIIDKNKPEPKKIVVFRKIEFSNYTNYFKKTIILDATAEHDYEILNSKVVFLDTEKTKKPALTLYSPKNAIKTSKTHFMSKTKKDEIRYKRKYEMYINKICDETCRIIDIEDKKILLVVYKDIQKIIEFKNDIIKNMKDEHSGYEKMYKVIHHNQYTTGVNKFNDYEVIIIVGALHKGYDYYKVKKSAIQTYELFISVMYNDFLISNIQQIGRTALRNKKHINVYCLIDMDLIGEIISGLGAFFDINRRYYDNEFFYWDQTRSKSISRYESSVKMNFAKFIFEQEFGTYSIKTLKKEFLKKPNKENKKKKDFSKDTGTQAIKILKELASEIEDKIIEVHSNNKVTIGPAE